MTATQNGPQVSGAGSGSSAGTGDDRSKIRKFEAAIILLVGALGGVCAGIGRRIMDHASYFGAISTGFLAGIGLCGFIIVMVKYIRGQS